MGEDLSGRKLSRDILRIIHAPLGSQSQEKSLQHNYPVETQGEEELGNAFFMQAADARYSVFQLIGQKVVKKDDHFEVDGGGYSHRWEADPVRNFIHESLNLEIMDLNERMRILNKRPESVGEDQVGVVSVYTDRHKNNTRLIVFGHFSLESRPISSGASNRTNGENSLYYFFPGEEPSAVQEFITRLNVKDKSREANTANRGLIVSTMFRIFPESVLKRIDSHMLRQIEVHEIIDRRE